MSRRYGVSHTAIQKRADKGRWLRPAKAVATAVAEVAKDVAVGNPAAPATTVAEELTARQIPFVDEYMRDRNATQAYIRAGYSPNGAHKLASRLMANDGVAAEIDRRIEEYSRCAGIERVALLEVCKRAVFADPRRAFDADGRMLPPKDWPDDLIGAIAGYKAAGEKTPEEIRFHDQPALALKLLDEISPLAKRSGTELTAFAALLEVAAQRALAFKRATIEGVATPALPESDR